MCETLKPDEVFHFQSFSMEDRINIFCCCDSHLGVMDYNVFTWLSTE